MATPFLRLSLLAAALLLAPPAPAQPTPTPPTRPATAPAPAASSSQVFAVNQPDFKLSPHTGMTREHWKDAALYLLTGAFSYVHRLEDPLKFPKQPGKTYPRTDEQIPTEKLEGLCRTLFLAMPLLRENPALAINGLKVAEYYRYHLGKLVDPASDTYVRPATATEGPSQNLVEFGGLAVSLFAAPQVLWDPLPKAQRDALAATMLSYGHGATHPSNWRFFNIFVLSFCKSQGYAINDKLLDEYLQKSLTHYRGQGWYNDWYYANQTYDYYSMWAFQMYSTLWSEFYGKQHHPAVAQQFATNFRDVQDNYPYMFSRRGDMIMWGRSISYRFGAIVPFPLTGFAPDPTTNYGWLRRISSGAILQFLQHPDFRQDQIPTLGFYGAFEPAVQFYSCRGSVFWMAKAFLGLLVPADNPFWTTPENEGPWEKELAPNTVYNNFQAGPQLLTTDYPNLGAAEIRTHSHGGSKQGTAGTADYNRLAYHSAFPWQADGPNGEVAMNYVFKNQANAWEPLRLYTFKKFEDGVYYRDAELESNPHIRLRLADLPLPNGVLRLDQNTSTESIAARLGHYALPNLTGTIKRATRKVQGRQVHLLDNGTYQLALVALRGWEKTETLLTHNLHPQKPESAVLNVSATFAPAPTQPVLYATLLLWKKAGTPWTDQELAPVKQLTYSAPDNSVVVAFADGTRKTVTFK